MSDEFEIRFGYRYWPWWVKLRLWYCMRFRRPFSYDDRGRVIKL